jgi:SAM-dependent methyltransferase/uncharacterized protein YbaR (Trm112 family)
MGLELAEGSDLTHARTMTSKGWSGTGSCARLAPTGHENSVWYHSSDEFVKILTAPNPLDSLHLAANHMSVWWTDILACPDCRADLKWHGGSLDPCPLCGRAFDVQDGVPILHPRDGSPVSEAGRQFFVEEPGRLDSIRQRNPRLARLLDLPDFTTPSKSLPRSARWQREHLVQAAPGERILNLGSGVRKLYHNTNILNFDIAPHENAAVVGNGERLPFRDRSFDAVVLDAVIEHLAHPQRVVGEVERVLKPGGIVLAQVPFLYPFHAAPHDYQRFTPAGLEVLFENFEVLESGTDRRPGRAVLEVMSAYAATFSDNRTISYALRWLTAWMWLPIKFLDPWLSRKSRASHVVAGSSILARKREAPGAPAT